MNNWGQGQPSGTTVGAVAVVIPCYQVGSSIAQVLSCIGPEVSRIYCVDDASRDDTAEVIRAAIQRDRRIQLIRREKNGGVGAAVMEGYRKAIEDGAKVLVKLDGDGQMNSDFIPDFVAPVLLGEADYVKGNRFFNLETVRAMPAVRVIGNAGLSFLAKLSSGYWDLFDPTNGYTALHAGVAATLPFDQIHNRYFFESDLLFRLGAIRARVLELPINSTYVDETSHLNELHCLLVFPMLHARNFCKRIFYNYFLRNFSIASINLVAGLLLSGFGFIFGLMQWLHTLETGVAATAGTVMLSALPFLLGVQLLLNFLAFDISMTPREAVHRHLSQVRVLMPSEVVQCRTKDRPEEQKAGIWAS